MVAESIRLPGKRGARRASPPNRSTPNRSTPNRSTPNRLRARNAFATCADQSCSRITTATLFATHELETRPVRQRFVIQTALRAVAIAILVLHAGLASAQRIPMPLPGGNPVLKPERSEE